MRQLLLEQWHDSPIFGRFVVICAFDNTPRNVVGPWTGGRVGLHSPCHTGPGAKKGPEEPSIANFP